MKTRINKIEQELKNQLNIRTNLSQLRQLWKESTYEEKDLFFELEDLIFSYLGHEDAKTRKNAVLLLGELECDQYVPQMIEAYQKEDTRFVKASYVTALAQLDIEGQLSVFKKRLEELKKEETGEENRKHLDEERRAIQNLLIQYEGITTHVYKGWDKEVEVILAANSANRDTLYQMVEGEEARIHGLGVAVKTRQLQELMKIRTYRELLFELHLAEQKQWVSKEPKEAAKELWESNMYQLLEELHKQGGPFYFRIECKSRMTLEERSNFTKKLTGELERLSLGAFINSTSDYEVEIRLIESKTGEFFPALKLYTISDKRFAYRKNAIASSIHPATAAMVVELAKPYLKKQGQILDPFCGVGTMLIERDKVVPAKEKYGIDTFGEAIEKARENAALGKARIHFIHRDFFDFKHEYLFDEIITNMPVRGKKTKEEMDRLYERFLQKASSVLAEQGIIIMYTNEVGLVKKNLRLRGEYQLIQETLMQKKNEFYLLILKKR